MDDVAVVAHLQQPAVLPCLVVADSAVHHGAATRYHSAQQQTFRAASCTGTVTRTCTMLQTVCKLPTAAQRSSMQWGFHAVYLACLRRRPRAGVLPAAPQPSWASAWRGASASSICRRLQEGKLVPRTDVPNAYGCMS